MAREAVIVDAIRTPIGKRGGALANEHPTDLLALVLRELADRHGVAARVDDVIGGCVTQVGEQGTNVTRNAWVAAGLPWTVPATTVDRQCGSSQQAMHFAAQGIMAGAYDVVIACGVESMTRSPMAANARGGTGPFSPAFLAATEGQLKSQFEVAQWIADRDGITRDEMDTLAMESHRRSAKATDEGQFDNEILPVPLHDEDGKNADTELRADEGIRRDTTLEILGNLRTAAAWDDTIAPDITAGNSSQMSDGAGAMLIADRDLADREGWPIRAAFRHFSVAAEDAVQVLTAPNRATRLLLERAELKISDLDLFEINEAFASIVLMWNREFGVDSDTLNAAGGAIALGHPLGCSGVRLMTTLLNRLEATNTRFGLQAMCEGGGQANATVIERLG